MKKIFITTTALLIACTLSAADLFVSPEGNDRNPGTKDSPKATLTAALRQARELRRLNDESVKGGITIHLEAGDYHLYEPVFIRPEDSGTEASPTVITSDGNAVLNGGVEIRNWKKQGKLWVADVPMFNGRPLDFRQLWIPISRNLLMLCLPNSIISAHPTYPQARPDIIRMIMSSSRWRMFPLSDLRKSGADAAKSISFSRILPGDTNLFCNFAV